MTIANMEPDGRGLAPGAASANRTRRLAESSRRALALFGALQTPLLFGVLLLSPLSVYPFMPGHDLLGGMFAGMGPWEIFFSTVPYAGASWSLLFIVGLLVEGTEARRRGGGKAFLDRDPSGDLPDEALHVPRWSLRFFSVPASWGQVLLFTLIIAPGLFVMIVHGDAHWTVSLAGALAGLGAAFVLSVLMTVPVDAACNDEDEAPGGPASYHALPENPLSPLIRRFLGSPVRRVSRRVREWATWVFRRTPFDDVIDEDLLHSDHYFALVSGAFVFLLLGAGRFAFEPPRPLFGLPVLPPAALVFTLLILVIFVFGAFAFHLGQFRISALLVVGAGLAGYVVTGQDHFYDVETKDAASVRLPALAAADVAGRGPNLVVVTATGGGIAASAWTTLVLTRLVTERPELARELRLISAVSGGAVGSAFLLDELARDDTAPPSVRFERAYERAATSSLSAVAHGLVFSDVPRLLSGGLFALGSAGRGALLEAQWRTVAGRDRSMGLGEFLPAIVSGRAPAVIFNATVMENGRRVLVTPLSLTGSSEDRDETVPQMAGPLDLPPRSQTLDEYLLGDPRKAAEIGLFTAARLSATFPYVTPAARASRDLLPERPEARHHLVDGGYYDNYGVASALEWLDLVLAAQQRGALRVPFERVAIVQIRVASPTDPSKVPAASGATAALAGPLIGVLNIRDGVAVTRNETELHRFIAAWNQKLGEGSIETFVFQPEAGETYPLSWHLSREQRETIERRWPASAAPGEIGAELARLTAFLDAG